MRIIAGRFRGLALAGVGKGDPRAALRPTPDRVRESLFSILTGKGVIEGARVLDLFAGTGALGLEALSRGAARVTFVDNGRTALGLIARNIALTRSEQDTAVLARDAARLGPNPGDPADLVFLDPPYGRDLGPTALAAARAGGWLAPGATIVWEEAAPQEAPEGFHVTDRRRYGASHLTFLTLDDGAPV